MLRIVEIVSLIKGSRESTVNPCFFVYIRFCKKKKKKDRYLAIRVLHFFVSSFHGKIRVWRSSASESERTFEISRFITKEAMPIAKNNPSPQKSVCLNPRSHGEFVPELRQRPALLTCGLPWAVVTPATTTSILRRNFQPLCFPDAQEFWLSCD